MAITRAQQARQMLKDGNFVMQGGVKNYLGKQETVSNVPLKWQSGLDKPSTELAYITKAEKDLLLKKDIHGSLKDGPNEGPEGIMSLDSQGDRGTYGDTGQSYGDRQTSDTSPEVGDRGGGYQDSGYKDRRRERARDPFYGTNLQGRKDLIEKENNRIEKIEKDARKKQGNFFTNLLKSRQKGLYNIIGNNPKTELNYIADLKFRNPAAFNQLPQSLKDLYAETEDPANEFSSYKDFDKFSFDDFNSLVNFDPGATGAMNFADYSATYAGAPGLKFSGNVGGKEKYVKGKDEFGRTMYGYRDKPDGDGGGAMSDYERRLLALEQATAAPAATSKEDDDEIINYRLMADGGRAGFAEGGMPYEGGIMDLESSRQMYGLGKLVKKITRGVKKIAKSPIGKAALAFGAYKLASPFLLGTKGVGMDGGLPGFLFKQGLTKGGFGTIGGLTTRGVLAGIGATSALSGFLTPEEEEEQKLYAGADIDDPRFIMANASKYTNPRLMSNGGSTEETPNLSNDPNYKGWVKLYEKNPDAASMNENHSKYLQFYNKKAEGGIMNAEPVAKKTMPLLDMGGKEMDLRAEGGFVPLGRMEKADDVPARLSKNEFVFTADAVRNAGEGDVDKGAEVMYNMMKNLESGGDVSEESQGLEGARDMFQTSQRLEEVL